MQKFIIKSVIIVLILTISGYIFYSFKKATPNTASIADTPILDIPPTTQTIEGAQIGSRLENKIVLINFWASWCAPCVEEFESMIKLTQLNPDVVIVAISEDTSLTDINDFLKTQKYKPNDNFLIVFDQDMKFSQQYKVEKLPESIIFNKNKQFIKKVIGSLNWISDDAQQFFKELK